MPDEPPYSLLPAPRQFTALTGHFAITPDCPMHIGGDDPRIHQAAQRWRALSDRLTRTLPSMTPGLRIHVDSGRVAHPQGYVLLVEPTGIVLTGGSATGCYHGLQTLMQLTHCGKGSVPACRIDDEPSLAVRGLLHDISRGKAPTLQTLKSLVDRLCALKINHLQLNIEHTFVFSFDPDICGPDDGLTPYEARELVAYGHERFVEITPALATLGHMGRILSMPRYRHLAEIESAKDWSAMTWPERARGLTLDCLNPEAHELIRRMLTEVLDAFPGQAINICGDEPYDLGKGRNAGRLNHETIGAAYLGHIRRVHEVCAARNRRTHVWSDVITYYPHLLPLVPQDATVLHWGYDDRADYECTARFVASGRDTWVCPGTTGWRRILNAMDLAERNITAFAAAAHTHGAVGLLNTDWGDHGHFNQLACSWHGIALGAACAWRHDHPTGQDFDARFAKAFFDSNQSDAIGLFRLASRWAERCETWTLLRTPIGQWPTDAEMPSPDLLDQTASAAAAAERWCAVSRPGPLTDQIDLDELRLAFRFTQFGCEKARRAAVAGGAASPHSRGRKTHEDEVGWADGLEEAASQYAACWRMRNKPSGLNDILTALRLVLPH